MSNDMKSWLQDHGIKVHEFGEHHHATRGRLQIDCPYCLSKGQFRMGISSTRANCWTCGPQRLIHTLALLTKEPYSVCEKFAKGQKLKFSRYVQPITGKYKPPDCVGDFQPAHIKYLEQRGYDPGYLKSEWRVGGIGLAPKLQWRIFIPVEFDGKAVSWTTRKITDKGTAPKYRNAEKTDETYSPKSLLYGEDFAQHRVIAVEGPMDVWKIGRGAVSLFGLSYTTAQVLRLSRYPVRYICFDNEPQAQRVAQRLCHELAAFPGKTHNIQLDSKDPGEAKPKELKLLRDLLDK